MEPASSWLLVRFVSAAPRRELPTSLLRPGKFLCSDYMAPSCLTRSWEPAPVPFAASAGAPFTEAPAWAPAVPSPPRLLLARFFPSSSARKSAQLLWELGRKTGHLVPRGPGRLCAPSWVSSSSNSSWTRAPPGRGAGVTHQRSHSRRSGSGSGSRKRWARPHRGPSCPAVQRWESLSLLHFLVLSGPYPGTVCHPRPGSLPGGAERPPAHKLTRASEAGGRALRQLGGPSPLPALPCPGPGLHSPPSSLAPPPTHPCPPPPPPREDETITALVIITPGLCSPTGTTLLNPDPSPCHEVRGSLGSRRHRLCNPLLLLS